MRLATFTVATALALASGGLPPGQNDWVNFGQDPGGTKFSSLAQINVDNVKNLKRAWTFHTGDSSGFFKSGPLVVDGVMYFSAQNGVFALDAAQAATAQALAFGADFGDNLIGLYANLSDATGGPETFFVAAIPEPQTYALMLAGLGIVGFMAARRRRDAL